MESATLTLDEFLLERITEDEVRARELAERRRNIWSEELWDGVAVPYAESPARVLAECDTKRQILAFATDHDAQGVNQGAANWLLKTLALPYADHEDYREEWRT